MGKYLITPKQSFSSFFVFPIPANPGLWHIPISNWLVKTMICNSGTKWGEHAALEGTWIRAGGQSKSFSTPALTLIQHPPPAPALGRPHLGFTHQPTLVDANQECQASPWESTFQISLRLSLRLILSTGLQNLFARIMFIQFLTYRDETRTQLKADESPSGCQLTRGSSGRKNEVASQGFCNYPQVFFFFLLSVYFEVISNFKKICKSSPKNSHITW